MVLSGSKRTHLILISSIAVFTVLLTLALFSSLYANGQYWDLFLSSDALYLPSLYQDIVVDKNSFDTWHLNPAPNFFPDMGFYFVLRFFCGNFIWSTFLFALIQVLLMHGLFLYIFREMFPGKTTTYSLLVILSLSLFGFEALYVHRDVGFAFHPFSNSYHMGAFIISVICFIISREVVFQFKVLPLLLIGMLCFATTLSDRLFLVLFPAPMSAAALFLWLRKRPIQVLIFIVIILGTSYAGMELFNSIQRNSYQLLDQSLLASNNKIREGWHHLTKNIYDVISGGGFKSLIFCLAFLSFPLLVIVAFKSRHNNAPEVHTYSVYFIFFTVIVILAPVMTGVYAGYDCLRYNIFPFFFGGMNLAVFLAYFFSGSFRACYRFIPVFGLVIVSCVLVSKISREGLNNYFHHYPAYVARLDSLAEKEGLKQGVGNYWIAKKVTMFSKKGLKVRAVFDDLSIYDHVSNDKWFFDNIFTFVVLNRFSDTTLYRREIKDTRTLTYDDELRVIKSAPFGYKREVGYRVVSFK